jgi:hypothetical protein
MQQNSSSSTHLAGLFFVSGRKEFLWEEKATLHKIIIIIMMMQKGRKYRSRIGFHSMAQKGLLA